MVHDSGYELEAARLINQNKELPLVGPAVGMEDFFIPPTYLYLLASIYSISGNILFISFFYALLGVLTIFIFTYFIYLLTNSKLSSLLIFIFFSVWHYHINYISRQIWHPNPIFFFSSLALLFGTLALKKEKITYLLIGQLFFFIALAIYPSPIFVFPIIFYNSFYFFKESIRFNRLESILCSLLTLFVNFLIVYLPLLIFEAQNQFISFQSLFDLSENQTFNFFGIFDHFNVIFRSFYLLFFVSHKEYLLIFLVFFLLVIFFIFRKNKKRTSYIKPFTSPFLLIWIIFCTLLLKNLSFLGAYHRFDVLALVFLIWLLLLLAENKKLNGFKEKFIFYLLISFFLFTSSINLLASFRLLRYKNIDSTFNNQNISQLILNSLNANGIPRSRTLIFSNLGQMSRDGNSAMSNLWSQKWQGEKIDHFINKTYFYTNDLIASYQNTNNYSGNLKYLKFDYYYLVCSGEDNDCVADFLFDLSTIAAESSSPNQFVIEEELLYEEDSPFLVKVYLVKNLKNISR